VAGQFTCTRCSVPLEAPSATGLCAACALATREELPPAAPPAPETPPALDGTAAGALPNPFAPTRAAPFDAPTASAPSAPTGDLPANPDGFTLIRRLGGGGMGDVYLAHEDVPNRFVAVKFMRRPGNTQLLERFRLEFRALANLDHPHSVRVFTYKFEGSAPYYAMELLEGGSVADRLRANGALAAADAVVLIRKVASAVQALHEHREHGCPTAGVIHRDIKPGNILLTKAGEPKLADFGLVKYLDADTFTHTQQEVGTAQYMPPEQFNRANGEVSYPADVYGLGATLYHLLTGCAPFTGDSVFEVRDAVLGSDPVRVRALRPEVPLALEAVVLKCLAKDPAERYQTVAELLTALEDPEADSAPRHTRGHRARRWLKRHARALATGALAAAALVAVAVALWPEPNANDKRADAPPKRPWTSAPVPPLGAPAQPELTPPAARAGLAGNKPVVLASDTVPRVPLGRGIGPCEVEAGRKPGDGFLLKSRGLSVVQLLDSPGVPGYTIRGQFRHDLKAPVPGSDKEMRATRCGIVLGHVRARDGETLAHFLVVLAFGEETDGRARELELGTVGLLERPLAPVSSCNHSPHRFPLGPRPDDGWRALEATVGPTGVTVRYDGQTKHFATADINHGFAQRAEELRRMVKENPHGIVAPEWGAHLPVGVLAWDSWVSIRNVTLDP
jgi:eukaryotic-like serine/threonine-protein kinase